MLLGQVSNIDLRLLRVFRSVVDSGGFSAAELELNIGRSTISRHIKELEGRLGVSLCHRGRSGFGLSNEGRVVYDATLRLLASMDEFRHELNEMQQGISGNLSLAMFDKTASNPASNISEALRLFERRVNDVTIEIHIEPINEIESGIIEGRYHVGIVPGHRESSTLNYSPLFGEHMRLYCGRQHGFFTRKDEDIHPDEVSASRYVGLGCHSPNMQMGAVYNMTKSATSFDQEGVITLILSGVYIGFLPDHYAQEFIDKGLLRALKPDEMNYSCEYNAIVRRAPKPSRLVALFLDCLDEAKAVEVEP